jgi:PAS domain S-box-containing protein
VYFAGEGEDRHAVRAAGTVVDINERKRVEEALQRSEASLAAAQRLAQIGSWEWDVRADTAHWSEETFRIFGIDRGSMEQHRHGFLDRIHPEDRTRVDRTLSDALNGSCDYDLHYRILLPDKTEKTIHALAEVVRDQAGEPLLMRGTVHDITDRKAADEALRHAAKMRAESEKLAATGRMAAQIAHEINNPLAGIKNSFRLIRAAVPIDNPNYDMVGMIEREIDRIALIVRQMYQIYSPRHEKLTEVPVAEVVHDVAVMLGPLCKEYEVTIACEDILSDLTISAHAGNLQQILYNLTTNAIHASPRGATVKIEAVRSKQDLVRIAVCDQGPGIPPELRPQLFDPFVSAGSGARGRQGLGLGLAIVKSIVDALQGRIEVECIGKHGTCVCVFLPSQRNSAHPEE